jgi:hypothetical protein
VTRLEIHGRRPRPWWRSARKQAQQDWEEVLTFARASFEGDGDIHEEASRMLLSLGGNAERWRRATRLALTHTAKAIKYWPANGNPQGARTAKEEEFYSTPLTWPLCIRAIEVCHEVFGILAGLQRDLDKAILGHHEQAD